MSSMAAAGSAGAPTWPALLAQLMAGAPLTAADSRAGSADVLEALGVAIDLEPAAVARCVEQVGIGFCFAPRFHPALRHAAGPRGEIGVPTVFNVLGPLTNPARVTRQALGVPQAWLGPVL